MIAEAKTLDEALELVAKVLTGADIQGFLEPSAPVVVTALPVRILKLLFDAIPVCDYCKVDPPMVTPYGWYHFGGVARCERQPK